MRGEDLCTFYATWKQDGNDNFVDKNRSHISDVDREDKKMTSGVDSDDIMNEIYHTFRFEDISSTQEKFTHWDVQNPEFSPLRPLPIDLDPRKVKKLHSRKNSRDKMSGYAYQHQDVTGKASISLSDERVEISPISPQHLCIPICYETETPVLRSRTYTDMSDIESLSSADIDDNRDLDRIETPLKTPRYHRHHNSFFASTSSEFDSDGLPVVHFDPATDHIPFSHHSDSKNSRPYPPFLNSVTVDVPDISMSPLTLDDKARYTIQSSSYPLPAAPMGCCDDPHPSLQYHSLVVATADEGADPHDSTLDFFSFHSNEYGESLFDYEEV